MEILVSEYPLRIVNIIELLIIFICVYGCFSLWPNQRFRGLCMVLGLEVLLMMFNFSEETGLFNQSYLITPVFSLCTGPVFYLFVRHLTYANHQWQWRQAGHFILAIIAIPLTAYTQWVLAAGSLSLLLYAIFSYRLLTRYNKAAQTLTSNDNMTRLSWLKGFMIVFGLLMLQDIIRLNSQPFLNFYVSNTWYLFHQGAVMITFAVLIHLAIHQRELFDSLDTYDDMESTRSASVDKQLNQDLFKQIDDLIKDERLFRQPRLSLSDISAATGLGIKEVSAAINEGGSMNFSEYINRMRVNYFIHHVKPDAAVLHLALEAGFNSKSSFNTLFKKYIKQTPSQYIKSLT